MILKGSQRGGARALARHLLNDRDNDHVTLHQLRGFIARDLRGALDEAHAVAKGTQCRQFLFSLSFNPPKGIDVATADFLEAIEEAERRLGLTGQPRAIIFHEKEGRRHAHAVWSRIDAQTMRAINLPFFKRKLTELSRELYLEHGWRLPDGLRRNGGRSPLNFTLAEWQQAKRLSQDPREIRDIFQDAWARSDNLAAFGHALEERGYFLARGDRRGLVAIDIHGEVYAVARWTGEKTSQVRAKFGDGAGLRSVAEVQALVADRVAGKLRGFVEETEEAHGRTVAPVRTAKAELVKAHRAAREDLLSLQHSRQVAEAAERAGRLHKGLRGLWQRLTGQARKIRRENEEAARKALERDQAERDALAFAQRREARPLQERLDALRRRYLVERRRLDREIAHHLRGLNGPERHPDGGRSATRTPRGHSPEFPA